MVCSFLAACASLCRPPSAESQGEALRQVEKRTKLFTNVKSVNEIDKESSELKRVDAAEVLSCEVKAVWNCTPLKNLSVRTNIKPRMSAVNANEYLVDVFY